MGGKVLVAPLRLQVRPRKFRAPDLLMLRDARDPLDDTITVLVLAGATYHEHRIYHRGQRAASQLLPSFSVRVDEVFDAT